MTSGARPSKTAVATDTRVAYPIVAATFLALMVFCSPNCLSARGANTEENPLVVGAVQFAVSPEIYQSTDAFRSAIDASLDKLEERSPRRPIDLAVFPEYSSAFLGWAFLSADERSKIQENPAEARPLIVAALQKAQPLLNEIWTDVAQERNFAILAGTALVAEPVAGQAEVAELVDNESVDREEKIFNRALLYSENGELIWTQDKTFPGAPESEVLNLSTGNPDDVQPIEINGQTVVVTICRDTYNEVWENEFENADLWIDIKANELPYTKEYYDQALAQRLDSSPIDTGLTVSLAGEFLGYNFTGVTEYFMNDESVAITDPFAVDAVLVVVIDEQPVDDK